MSKLLCDKDSGDAIIVKVGDTEIGSKKKVIISGPCAVEDYDTMISIATQLKLYGVNILRGGAFKPRTSPYDFQGLGKEGLEILKAVREEVNIPVSTEIMDTRDVEEALNYIDVIQIGSRNMYNYSLLKEVGKLKTPIILKRGISATINEWINAAEYILREGNENVILCERGIRTFETYTRNTLDLNAVAFVKTNYRLPIIVDPSHGTGLRELVHPMSLASIAAGADGLLIESHINPDLSISDANQTISINTLSDIINDIKRLN
ncbi:3-deoxy-7-phosphoheptulonate synthase [Clostridium algidicarnis]|uniref:3-deoxy-7-phosphoheptulonate synthase n=1 Tax=Clostridium algidicarnis TaxID=37659 RepID=UPI00162A872A|nr:3-deoxy-7-phosphoheptulonate synthase [Clostridium algidicarnis]MBB6631250.1 3-deoxy-7-phosphoheptulonate synthase [Clostridium algidicarnis]MBU3193838.1 3-deoxy-7-phosphoheptulonate synthase [Clostridium algidicarnis]MBU3205424.1 3-deoxy-7-phosphoheptulonate synthase [Clostridium algidicarnis]